MEENSKQIKNMLLFFTIITVFVIASQLSVLLIPLVLAILLASLFQPLIIILKRYKIPNLVIVPLIASMSILVIYLIITVIGDMYSDILRDKDFLIERLFIKFNGIIAGVNDLIGTNFSKQTDVKSLIEIIDSDFLSFAASGVANVLGSFTGSFLMFSVYYILLLAGMSNYRKYLIYISGGLEHTELLNTYETVQRSIFSYVIIKSIVSLTTGLFVYLICLGFDINYALFWGFLAFLLNYIPSVGSIFGSIPPVLMSFIQYDSLQTVFFVLVLIALVQFIMGNLIEPKIMGETLRINIVTVIFGLVFWGWMWGVPGMILSVPLLVLIKLIFEQFPSLKVLARIMGSPSGG